MMYAIEAIIKEVKKNRSPGIDGMTSEHLNSVFLGGNREDALEKVILVDYAVGTLISTRKKYYLTILLTPED